MREYKVDAKSFARKFLEIEQARPAAVIRGIVSAALLGAEIIARRAPKDLGILRKSVHADVQDKAGAIIIVDAPHASMVELGSRPHWAPLKPLLEWAKRKVGDADAYRLAKGVQNKIAREGTKPTYFVRKSLPLLRRILKAEVEREIALDKEG